MMMIIDCLLRSLLARSGTGRTIPCGTGHRERLTPVRPEKELRRRRMKSLLYATMATQGLSVCYAPSRVRFSQRSGQSRFSIIMHHASPCFPLIEQSTEQCTQDIAGYISHIFLLAFFCSASS